MRIDMIEIKGNGLQAGIAEGPLFIRIVC